MRKIILLQLLLVYCGRLYAQTEMITQKNVTSTNSFSLMSSQSRLNHSNPISAKEIANDHSIPPLLCLNISGNLIRQQHYGSLKLANFGRGNDNPYKVRNIGIGFLIGGAINAGAGAYYIYSFESDPAYWDIDIFFAEIVGAGAIVIGGASIIGGTIATIIGSVQGYRYAHSNLKFKSDGKSFGLAYNF